MCTRLNTRIIRADDDVTGPITGAAPFLDDRLLGEPAPKVRAGHRLNCRVAMPLILVAIVLYVIIGAHEAVASLQSALDCTPTERIQAGENITCTIQTSPLASETDLTIVPTGVASDLALLHAEPHFYRVGFATASAGTAGVRLQHTFFEWALHVEVMAAEAVTAVPKCWPTQVTIGQAVTCMLVPRDRFGNAAEVVRPADASVGYFSVTPTGNAHDITVGDTSITFQVSEPGRAGVLVVLNGQRSISEVEVLS
mmetsp:Transcript_1905/g.4089  ORF Transcript_1905/g.4089 Transcript_1905/m.4089 type:complete len:254 (+) Transcript_1905:101-862(+)